jgi:hypothetical protein
MAKIYALVYIYRKNPTSKYFFLKEQKRSNFYPACLKKMKKITASAQRSFYR